MRPLLIALLVTIATALLYVRFPYALHDAEDIKHLLYIGILLLFIIFRNRLIREMKVSQALRYSVAWGGIFLLMVWAYSYRDADIFRRIRSELRPQEAITHSDGSIVIHASEGGHFMVEASVNGVEARFMVDTGASDIVLSPSDAKRMGLTPETLRYEREYSTANGYGAGAKVILHELNVGGFSLSNIEASVNKADMEYSLLGMQFLRRLKRFYVEGNTLVLIP